MEASAIQNKIDLQHARNIVSPSKFQEVEKLVDEISETYGLEYRMLTHPNPFARVWLLAKYIHLTKSTFLYYVPIAFPSLDPIVRTIKRIKKH